MEVVKKIFESKIKSAEDGSIEVTISTKAKDRYGDIVEPKGCIFENFLNNPVVTFAHDYHSIPIGKAEGITINDEGVFSKVRFAPGEVNPIAPYVKNAYEQGFMRAWSVGFSPIEKEPIIGEDGVQTGWRYTKWELLEFSAVPIPANPETGTHLKGLLRKVEKYEKEEYQEEEKVDDKKKVNDKEAAEKTIDKEEVDEGLTLKEILDKTLYFEDKLQEIGEKLDSILIFLKNIDKLNGEENEPTKTTDEDILEMDIDDLDVEQVEEIIQKAIKQVDKSLSILR